MESATPSSGSQRTDALEILLEIGCDLTASLGSLDRYERLLVAVKRILPFDVACLLRLQGDELVPLAAHGLVPAALGRLYLHHRHPRLEAILCAPVPILFPHDSALPDPFAGLLTTDLHAPEQIHARLGCPLTCGGEVVGVLTADALDPNAFDGLDVRLLSTLGALAGAALRTATLIEALEKRAEHGSRMAREIHVASGARREGPSVAAAPARAGGSLREQVEEFERRLIREAVERHGGNQAAAARELGMHRANLHHLARRLGVKG